MIDKKQPRKQPITSFLDSKDPQEILMVDNTRRLHVVNQSSSPFISQTQLQSQQTLSMGEASSSQFVQNGTGQFSSFKTDRSVCASTYSQNNLAQP